MSLSFVHICLKVTQQEEITHRQVGWVRRPEKCAIFWPFIFEENEITLTVNSYRYKNMITDFLGHKLKDEKSTWLTYGSSETGYCSCGPTFNGYSSSVVHWASDLRSDKFGDLRSTEQMWKPCTLKDLNKAAIRNLTALINVQLLLDKMNIFEIDNKNVSLWRQPSFEWCHLKKK